MIELSTALTQLPRDAEGHFRLLFHAAVFRLISYVRWLSEVSGERAEIHLRRFPFLADYFEALRPCLPEGLEWGDSLRWWREQAQMWEANCRARLPLVVLARQMEMSHEQQLALVMAGVVEEDIRFGSLFAALQEPLASRRPCLGLLAALIGDPAQGRSVGEEWGAMHELVAAGLIVAENRQAPRAEWVLRVPAALWDAVRGRTLQRLGAECRLYSRREFPPLKRLVLDASLRERLCRLPAVISRGRVDAVILRGMADSGRRTVMGSLARALGRDLFYYDRRARTGTTEDLWPMIGPLCSLAGAFPVIDIDPAPGETVELPPVAGYRGPIGVVMRREGGVSGPSVERAITLKLPSPASDHRLSIWLSALGEQAGDEIETIVDRFLLPLGNLHRAAEIATSYAMLERRETVTAADVQLACRSLNRQTLDTLAQRLDASGDWSGIVVNEATSAELSDLERRCRHRERLIERLGAGFGSSINRGVRALFNGPSGTGKTLAAKILASVLQMDVYRVDLAAIINKYIGETEKNLSQLLARAEEMDVILLVDEGDSLMTNRTDVKSANDRYANLETNYLLQRLETYEGVVVVTTNVGSRIDTAFQRRFDVVVDFHPPDAYERLLIWHQHLPAIREISSAYLQEVSGQCALTGGQIRNAALHAALLAVDGGRDGAVNDQDLEMAVQREYRKAGGSCPLLPPSRASNHHANGHHAALARFLEDIH